MPFDYPRFRRRYKALKRNLNVAREYHASKPSTVGVKIPIHSRFGKVNQQGISKTHVSRRVELDAGKPQVIVKRILLESEIEKRAAVLALWQEAADWSRRRDGHGIYGAARHSWIAGKLGLTLREVRFLLGKTK